MTILNGIKLSKKRLPLRCLRNYEGCLPQFVHTVNLQTQMALWSTYKKDMSEDYVHFFHLSQHEAEKHAMP